MIEKVVSSFVDIGPNKGAWNNLFTDYDDDNRANQEALIKMLSFCLCSLKVQEKDAILTAEQEEYKSGSSTLRRPKSIFIRFIRNMKLVLHNTAHKTPHNCKAFFAMYAKLLKFSGEEILSDATQHDAESEAYKIGMKAFFNENVI